MPSPAQSKIKGRSGENEVVAYLQTIGFPQAERRRLTGSHDKGDIAGIPLTVIEVKTCATPDVAAWMREAETERRNAQANIGVVWWRPPRRTNPARHLCIVGLHTLVALIGGPWPFMVTFPGTVAARNLATIADNGDICAWWPNGVRRDIAHAALCLPAWRLAPMLVDYGKAGG